MFLMPGSRARSGQLGGYRGRFLPFITFGAATTGITYTTQHGEYTKIANVVAFAISITLSSKGSATGTAVMNGLPFPCGPVLTTAFIQVNNMAVTVATAMQGVINSGGATTIQLQRMATGAATQMADTDFNNNSVIRIAGIYFTS